MKRRAPGSTMRGQLNHFASDNDRCPEPVLQRRGRQIAKATIQVEAFMNKFIPITETALPKQLRLSIVGKPAAMFDPSPQKIILAGNEVRVGIRASGQYTFDLIMQFRGRPLVGIQTKDPIMGGVRSASLRNRPKP